MKYRTLGRTGLECSEIGFGCWAIGGTSYGPTRDEESLDALEAAWERGVTFFDTADTYGHGHSEKLLARFLQGKPRDKVIIASKAGWDFYHGASRKNFDEEYLRYACIQSLARLGVETIDLYQLHNPGLKEIRNGEVVDALEDLKAAGKIRFIGISVHREEEAMAAIEDGRVDVLQVIFNMLDQRMAERVFARAATEGIGIIAREPLACGMLSGKYGAGHEFARDDHRRRWNAEKIAFDLKKIGMIRSVLATDRLPLAQAALEYVLEYKAVSTVIPGAKTRQQVLENLKASESPEMRIQESSQIRQLWERETLFRQGLLPR